MSKPQSFKSHARWDVAYHFVLAPIVLLNVAIAIAWQARHHVEHAHIGLWFIVLSAALVIAVMLVRTYSLKVQDRVIRLEEKLRLATLVSPDQLAELDSLTVRQYVGLRFASNPELPELARRAVRENLTEKQIKASIKAWCPDHHRV